jgi:HD superfamily phosphodiesterase
MVKHSPVTPEHLERVKQFVRDSTVSFDPSHDAQHAFDVYEASINIINSLDLDYEEDMITYGSLCHDLIDYKYKDKCISPEKLMSFLEGEIGKLKAGRVVNIVSSLSWSGEVKGVYGRSSEMWDRIQEFPQGYVYDQLYTVVIRDADRIQALGEKGIQRCIDLGKARGLSDHETKVNTWVHCKEKLLRLMPEKFIVTPRGRWLAQPGHDYIHKWYLYTDNVWTGGGR